MLAIISLPKPWGCGLVVKYPQVQSLGLGKKILLNGKSRKDFFKVLIRTETKFYLKRFLQNTPYNRERGEGGRAEEGSAAQIKGCRDRWLQTFKFHITRQHTRGHSECENHVFSYQNLQGRECLFMGTQQNEYLGFQEHSNAALRVCTSQARGTSTCDHGRGLMKMSNVPSVPTGPQ